MKLTQQKGGAKSEALPSITEESSNKKAADAAPQQTKSAEVSKNNAEVSKNNAEVSKNNAEVTRSVANPRTHAIDPMTLSLIPLSGTTSVNARKTTSPVIEHNPASATPTSEGTTPTSAMQLALMSSSNGSSSGGGGKGASPGDLMTFSLSPAVVEGILQPKSGGSKVNVAGHHLENPPNAAPASSEANDDLIKFSLTPAQLGLSTVPPSQARTNFGSKFPPSPSSVPKSHSPNPGRAGHSHSRVVNGSATPPPPLKPEWEHFSDSTSRPVAVAPQKLIPPKGGMAKLGLHGNTRESGTDKAWTTATKVGGSGFAPQPPTEAAVTSPAVRELKRIASLSDDQEAGKVGVATTTTTIGEGNQKSSDNGQQYDRRFSPLPPTPDELEMPTLQKSRASPPTSRGVTKVNADAAPRSTLLDDLEYAFPAADAMFTDPLQGGGSKVKGRGTSDDRRFDYADIDVEKLPGRGVAKVKGASTATKVDYAEVRTEQQRHAFQVPGVGVAGGVASGSRRDNKHDTYVQLADISTMDVKRTGGQPIRQDPLYATVDKTKQPPPPSSSTAGGGMAMPRPHRKGESPQVQSAAGPSNTSQVNKVLSSKFTPQISA